MGTKTNIVDLDLFIKDYLDYEQIGVNLISANKEGKVVADNLQRELDFTRTSLRNQEDKIKQLDKSMTSLKKSLCDALRFESQNESLVAQINQTNKALDNSRKEHETRKTNMENHFNKMRTENLMKIKEIQIEHQQEIKAVKENFRQGENTKAELIDRLRTQHRQIIASKDSEMIKLRLEYEKQLSKTRATPKQDSALSSHGQQQIDIFRKKLQFVQSESSAEISQLKQKISELQHIILQHNGETSSNQTKRRKTELSK